MSKTLDLPPPIKGVRFRPIPGFRNRYAASSSGHVWARARGKWLCKKERLDGGGRYLLVDLWDETGRQRTFTVHSLVSLAFRGARSDGMETRHLNGIKTDNRLANLAYGTPAENQMDRIRHGHTNAILTPKDVKRIRQRAAKGTSLGQLSKRFGMSRGALQKAIHRRTWKHVR